MKKSVYAFTPHQAYLEKNTVYYSYKPAPTDPLYGLVFEVYQVDSFDIQKTLAFPDICADIIAFYTESNCYSYVVTSTDIARSMEKDFGFMNKVKSIFGIKLCTGAAGNLFNCRIRDIDSSATPADIALVNGKESIKQLKDATSYSKRWAVMEKYLIGQSAATPPPYGDASLLISFITREIINSCGALKIKELEDSTGYSSRYIRKKFNEMLGISVKKFAQITQLQYAYHLFHESNLSMCMADLAAQSGYYDQSHMNSCFKQLTGMLTKNAVNLYQY